MKIEQITTSIFTEIRTDYMDENGVIHIDGYKTDDDDEQGVVIGYFIGGTVYWTNPDYQMDYLVQEVVKELKEKEGTLKV